ncbi:MAG: lipid-A-disaccharide synthase [Devosia sp.]
MADAVRLFLTAGEASGDHIGADLVKALRARGPLVLTGVGGTELRDAGLTSLYPMEDLAVMGFVDVIARLPLLLRRIRETVDAIVRDNPQVVVLIDSQVFSATVARKARARGYRGAILLYVAPSVWAWKPERAEALRGVFDEVLAVLPFEPNVMADLGGPPTHYVGHPALAHVAQRHSLPERGPLLLLPGSRGGELRRHLPLMADVARAFATHPKVTRLVLPTPHSQHHAVSAAIANWHVPIEVVSDAAVKATAFSEAIAAAAVSGTVTLELALAGIPTVVTYVADGRQHRNWIKAGQPRIALPNIVAGREVVPEATGTRRDAKWVIEHLHAVLDGPGVAQAQFAEFRAMRAAMERGVEDAAERVLARVSGSPV